MYSGVRTFPSLPELNRLYSSISQSQENTDFMPVDSSGPMQCDSLSKKRPIQTDLEGTYKEVACSANKRIRTRSEPIERGFLPPNPRSGLRTAAPASRMIRNGGYHTTIGQLQSPTSPPFVRLQRLHTPASSELSNRPITEFGHAGGHYSISSHCANANLPVRNNQPCIDYDPNDPYAIPDSPPSAQSPNFAGGSSYSEALHYESCSPSTAITGPEPTFGPENASSQDFDMLALSAPQRNTHPVAIDEQKLPADNSGPGHSSSCIIPSGEDYKDPMVDCDSYSLCPSDEEEMLRLLGDAAPAVCAQTPSPSIIQHMDRDSSIEMFDPNLQHSSPGTSLTKGPAGAGDAGGPVEEDLLSSDIEWDDILPVEFTKPVEGHDTAPDEKDNQIADCTVSTQSPVMAHPTRRSGQADAMKALSADLVPFARPAFPKKVRDRSPVIGISSSASMRTCFRIGELLNEAARCFAKSMTPGHARLNENTTFEFFARVTYSHREPGMSKIQHFQFRDLFKDQRPYPTGTLQG